MALSLVQLDLAGVYLGNSGPSSTRRKRTQYDRSTVNEPEIALRITLVDPPRDVAFAVQEGRDQLHEVTRSTGATRTLTVKSNDSVASPLVFLGPFTQGPPSSRFVYVNSGTSAGDRLSCWTRRAKIPLVGITAALLRELETNRGAVLEARIAGKSRDGGPACATVPLLDGGWRVALAR
jgi:Family of unknown function (DUF5990)